MTGHELKELRTGKGLTQRALAAAIGHSSSSYICEMETGKWSVPPHVARRVIRATAPGLSEMVGRSLARALIAEWAG